MTEAASDMGPIEHSLTPITTTRQAESVLTARAFRAMYDAQLDFVWRNLRRLGVREAEVDDKAQEVFVIAHRRFAEFEDRGHGPRAWLFQIVLRVASDARRHRRRHPEDPDGGDSLSFEAVEPEQARAPQRREALERLHPPRPATEGGRGR